MSDPGARPPTPDTPVAGFYRCTGPEPRWMYYNGETWVGEAVELPWYRRPMPAVPGRPPVGALIAFCVVVAAGVVIWLQLR